MARTARSLVLVLALALLVGACASSSRGDSVDAAPTPLPTRKPVFIPTAPPTAPTADTDAPTNETSDSADDASTTPEGTTEPGEGTTTSTDTGPSSSDSDNNSQDGDEPEPTAEPTAAPTATPQPQVIPLPTTPPAPQPTARPAPLPTAAPVCPGGQVIVRGACACPAGQAKRPSDGECVRLCNQADLTINNTCVCTGTLYDNGGQCVKRCLSNEVPDDFGGCKPAGTDPAPIN